MVPSGRGSLPPAPGSSGGRVAGGALPGGGAAAKPPFLPPSPGSLFSGFFWSAGYLAPATPARSASRMVDRKGHRVSRRQNDRKEPGVRSQPTPYSPADHRGLTPCTPLSAAIGSIHKIAILCNLCVTACTSFHYHYSRRRSSTSTSETVIFSAFL